MEIKLDFPTFNDKAEYKVLIDVLPMAGELRVMKLRSNSQMNNLHQVNDEV